MDNKNITNTGSTTDPCMTRYEIAWVMALTGTGLGAGVLYLPFAIGAAGFLPVVILTAFCIPLIFLSHRNLSRVCLAPSFPGGDMHSVVKSAFPQSVSYFLLVVCFFSVFPTLLIYAIGVTNITGSFIEHQLLMPVPDKGLMGVVLITLLVAVLAGGEKWLLRVVSGMVMPLTLIMLCLAVYLVPYWKADFLFYSAERNEFWKVLFLGLPVMTFSFYHAPMCSIMARGYRDKKNSFIRNYSITDRVHLVSTVLLFAVIVFFVVSCLMCLSQEDLVSNQGANLPILSVLANQSGNPWFSIIAPVIAFLSISTSFFGFFLGTVELINRLLVWVVRVLLKREGVTPGSVHRVSIVFAAVGCWVAAVGNWDILNAIAGLVAPMMAIVVFFIPLVAIYRVPELSILKNPRSDVYVLICGVTVVFSFLISLMFDI